MKLLDQKLLKNTLLSEVQALLIVLGFFILFKGLPDLIKISIELKLGSFEFLLALSFIIILFIPLYLPVSSLLATLLARTRIASNKEMANLHLLGVSLKSFFLKYYFSKLLFLILMFSLYIFASQIMMAHFANGIKDHLGDKFTELYPPGKTHKLDPLVFFYEEKTSPGSMKNANFHIKSQKPEIVLSSKELKLKSDDDKLFFNFKNGEGAFIENKNNFKFKTLKFNFSLKDFVASYFLDSALLGMLNFSLIKIFMLTITIHIFSISLFWLLIPRENKSYIYCFAAITLFTMALSKLNIYSANSLSNQLILTFSSFSILAYIALTRIHKNEVRFSKSFN